ncbi:MAG: hypothetical protein V1809_13855 [Planctomycetota bacterium]
MNSRKRYIRLIIAGGIIFALSIGAAAFFLRTMKPIDTWVYTRLPTMTEWRLRHYCKMSPAEREEFYRTQMNEARLLSDRLERYIREWHAGRADARLPKGLLPPSMDNEKAHDWVLMRSEDIRSDEQWFYRPAMDIPEDFSRLYFLGPDNHYTYAKLLFVAPIGAQLLVEGEFGHTRFMDFQIIEPFDPRNPTTSGMGAPEVPIVDVDIEPDPGSVNSFRPGARRDAPNRSYHLVFDLDTGNALERNPQAMIHPAYRAPGNRRVGGPFAAAGPLGEGQLIASVLWLRYYAPDKAAGPLAGVPLPKAMLRLRTGETFWIKPDLSRTSELFNTAVPGYATPPEEPPACLGPSVGWFKLFGYWLMLADGKGYPLARPWGYLPRDLVTSLIRERDAAYFGRGANMPPPGNHEIQASGCNYNTYLCRVVWLGSGKIYVLTGKLPRTPRTRDGETIATTAEARYWSIARFGNERPEYPCVLYGSLMDDEITTDSDGRYVIVYSRRQDRPANARPECGVTWQDFGPESRQVLQIRWTSVMPDDYLPQYAPTQNNIPWETGEWSSPNWDANITFRNDQNGFLKEYQPLVHYMTREEFERLGDRVRPEAVPRWGDE